MLDIKNVITSFFRLQLSVKMLHWNISDTELLAYLEKIIDKVILSDYYKNVENELRAIMDELLELLYTNIYLLRTVKI